MTAARGRTRRAGLSRRCGGRADAVPGVDDRSRAALPGSSGPARCRRVCSAPTIAASIGAKSPRCGTCRSARNGSAAAMTMPASIRSRPIRATPSAWSSRISCGGVWDTDNSGESWALRGDGLVAAYMPPELAGQKETQDPHRVVRCARRARHDVDAASLRHFPLDRRRRHLDAAQIAGRRFRLRRRRPSARSAHRLVRAGDQGRDARAARRRAWP